MPATNEHCLPRLQMRSEPITHLWNAGETREKGAIARWSFGHAHDLPVNLGLVPPRGWWCGFFLSRDLFGEREDGDVDFIAGPTAYSYSAEELAAKLKAARDTDPQLGEARFHLRAGQEGLVVWPPEIKEVVACEIKASHFSEGAWRHTHANQQRKILGQMNFLRKHGVNRVAFLHLGATKPTDELIETWRAADKQLTIAAESFPDAFPKTDVSYGYFRAVMACDSRRSGVHGGRAPRHHRRSDARIDQPDHRTPLASPASSSPR